MHRSTLRRGFLVELLLLAAAAPALYFPNWFPGWAPLFSLGALAAGWIYRRRTLRAWLVRTPADWPLFFLFLVLLPISVAVSPGELRDSISLPRSAILVWNFCLFWFVVSYCSRSDKALHWVTAGFVGLSTLIALVAPLGMNWLYKVPAIANTLQRIPTPLTGIFRGAENGFSPNQVAGALLFFLPLSLALLIYARLWRFSLAWWLLVACSTVMMAVLLLTQSRAALLGFACGLALMVLLPSRRGRRLLLIAAVVITLTTPLWFDHFMAAVGDAAPDASITSVSTLNVRFEVWQQAVQGIADFPFTGLGLGAFRELVRPLYELITVDPDYDIAHAHNIFLQTALDLGIPGMIALLAIYLAAAVQVYTLGRREAVSAPSAATAASRPWRAWALGFAASLVAQTVYSQLDAVALGSKPNLLFWGLIGLIFAAASLQRAGDPA